MEPNRNEDLDRLVDGLLRDRDFLLAQELKQKVDQLNELLAQSVRQELQVELLVDESKGRGGRMHTHVDIKIFKEL
ncbi:MAG: hypothetical protein RIE53_00890 [Rhodothermales bacterium]